ncbi:hypothetical protein QBC41DRAFT_219443 [Cercophora samala]|uniref:Uncharacterized protein n=1 Tax=Cercophora samala TaxID=330535 RepID=A0AA40DEM4_9PEZI|nr:hypothetical protein QBC41DRAFT_219443 [Cercophora samala]
MTNPCDTATSIINPDLTLLIAEETDLPSLLTLARTNKHLHALIHTHERSIIKSKITAAIPNPFLQPPLGSVLSSHDGLKRQILPPWSFKVAAELERRHARIETMFNAFAVPQPPLISAMTRVRSFVALSPPEFLYLVQMFKQTCVLVDQICDLAILVKVPAMARDPPPADPYMVQKAIHRTRQAFIKGLAPLDLALLTHLAALGGMAYAEEMGGLLSSDPEGLERMVAYKETILREGSAALWGFLHPEVGVEVSQGNGPPSLPPKARGSALGRFIAGKVEGVLRDLHAYEMGLKEQDEDVVGEGDKEGGREGMGEDDVDDDDPFAVLHGLHQTVMSAFPKPVEEPEESDGDVEMEDVREEGEIFEYEEEDLSGDDVSYEEQDGEVLEEEEVYRIEPREKLILEVVRCAVPY